MIYDVSSKVLDHKYAKFLGITIVAHVDQSHMTFWKNVYDWLCNISTITDKYLLLPPSSYHMTYYDITTQRKTLNFAEYINTNKKQLEQIKNNLLLFRNAKAVIKNIVVERVILLELEIGDDEEKLIRNFSNLIDIEHKIPTIFHVTLGYLHEQITCEECNNIYTLLKSNLILDHELLFELPKLCYFNDMTQFTEFNEITNPFFL